MTMYKLFSFVSCETSRSNFDVNEDDCLVWCYALVSHKFADVLEVLSASIVAVMVEAVRICETSANF
jgi:hypothetical protein